MLRRKKKNRNKRQQNNKLLQIKQSPPKMNRELKTNNKIPKVSKQIQKIPFPKLNRLNKRNKRHQSMKPLQLSKKDKGLKCTR